MDKPRHDQLIEMPLCTRLVTSLSLQASVGESGDVLGGED